MASETVHKQEFRIRDLSTRSVVLFPTRAQIIREIKEISLKPGQNQIIIDGLGPTVDEHSIKVDGTGAATITDLAVELLPNRDIYEEIYPSDSEDDTNSEDDESESESDSVKEIDEKIKKLNDDLIDEKEKINSAASRLTLLENYSSSVKSSRPSDLDKVLSSYYEERASIFAQHKTSTESSREIQAEISKHEKEKSKLLKAAFKAGEKARKEKLKEQEKKMRRLEEVRKEKARIRTQRGLFWPKKVYRIIISVEPSTMTPGSSRRGSISSETSVAVTQPSELKAAEVPSEISITLSYITYSASWSPRYDLNLNTVKSAGSLDYGAELINTTSETWVDAKVVLSTSQTTDQGLNEQIPTLHPWHVCLRKMNMNGTDSALYSNHEIAQKRQQFSQMANNVTKSREGLFGMDRHSNAVPPPPIRQSYGAFAQKPSAPQQSSAFGVQNSNAGGLFGGAASGSALFGSSTNTGGLFGQPAQASAIRHRSLGRAREAISAEVDEDEDEDEAQGFALFDDEAISDTIVNPVPALVFEEGSWEESGMTTTYDVPGLKTLVPSNLKVKHKIAKVEFKNVIFSHIIIGKLRQVAYLKARIRNSSKIAFLKGPLGLTLDGSFLGQTTLPRCSAGETFSLPLGIDPAITISYSKPTVRRSQSGIFNKEDSNIFSRSISITNTKPNTAVDITVLDQVPVSEDERLRIEVSHPRGLKVGSERISTGTNNKDIAPPSRTSTSGARNSVYASAADKDKGLSSMKWGAAEASMKKGGEVSWNVRLLPAQGVKLVLEYEATFPGGESVVAA